MASPKYTERDGSMRRVAPVRLAAKALFRLLTGTYPSRARIV